MAQITEFFLQNRAIKQTIHQKFRNYQQDRLTKIKPQIYLSRDIQKAARNKRIGISPDVKLLFEAIGDTIEDSHDLEDDPV